MMVVGMISYLALSKDDQVAPDPVAQLPVQQIAEGRVALAMHPVLTLEQAEKISSGIDAENSEIVFGLNVRKDRTCTLDERYIESEDGELIRAIECVPAEKPAGLYDHFDNPTLVGMSYSDAGAAEELGARLSEADPETARDLMLRAVALDPENTEPLLWLAANNYSATAKNGEPALNEMQESYVLRVVAEGMGGYGNPEFSARLLRDASFTEQDFADLDAIANEELQKIRDIQLDVTGKTTVVAL